MARRRFISTDLGTNPQIRKLQERGGDFAVLLMTWLIPHADGERSVIADPEELLYTVIPGRRDKTADDIATALRHMHDLGLVSWGPLRITLAVELFSDVDLRTSREYGAWRGAVFCRDGYQCTECGAVDRELHAHHIQSWAAYPDLRFELENGVTLCNECHVAAHRKEAQ